MLAYVIPDGVNSLSAIIGCSINRSYWGRNFSVNLFESRWRDTPSCGWKFKLFYLAL